VFEYIKNEKPLELAEVVACVMQTAANLDVV
jgi:hypothetical protein